MRHLECTVLIVFVTAYGCNSQPPDSLKDEIQNEVIHDNVAFFKNGESYCISIPKTKSGPPYERSYINKVISRAVNCGGCPIECGSSIYCSDFQEQKCSYNEAEWQLPLKDRCVRRSVVYVIKIEEPEEMQNAQKERITKVMLHLKVVPIEKERRCGSEWSAQRDQTGLVSLKCLEAPLEAGGIEKKIVAEFKAEFDVDVECKAQLQKLDKSN